MSSSRYDSYQRNTYRRERHRRKRHRRKHHYRSHSSSRRRQYRSLSRSYSRSRSRSHSRVHRTRNMHEYTPYSRSRRHRYRDRERSSSHHSITNGDTRKWSRSKSPHHIFKSITKSTKTRKNKKWEEWEEQFIINERKNIIKYSNKKIKKLTDNDWKNISSKLEKEIQRKGKADIGREWNVIKNRFNINISKNRKYYNDESTKHDDEDIRVHLQEIEDFRGQFLGEFQNFGDDKGKKKTTQKKKKYICLTNIRSRDNNGKVLCDHVWLNVGKQINDLGWINKGITIQFDARVTKYRKGSIKRGIKVQYDYRFSYPSKVKLYHETPSIHSDNKDDDIIKIESICSALGVNAKYGKLYHFKNHIGLYSCIDDLLLKYDDASFKVFVDNKRPCTQHWCRDIKQAFSIKGVVAPLSQLKKNICLRFNELKIKYVNKENQDNKDDEHNQDNEDKKQVIVIAPPTVRSRVSVIQNQAVFQWNPFIQPSLPLFNVYPPIGLPPPMLIQPPIHIVSQRAALDRQMDDYWNNYNYSNTNNFC